MLAPFHLFPHPPQHWVLPAHCFVSCYGTSALH